jgi:caa(3)-type oxidase subunit IV
VVQRKRAGNWARSSGGEDFAVFLRVDFDRLRRRRACRIALLVTVVPGPAFLGIKALLVIWYFMHVGHAHRVTKVFAAAGFEWLSVLCTMALLEYATR